MWRLQYVRCVLLLRNDDVNVEAQLRELRDYMVHKDITMERIKELEEKLAAQRADYEHRIKQLQANVASERNKYE